MTFHDDIKLSFSSFPPISGRTPGATCSFQACDLPQLKALRGKQNDCATHNDGDAKGGSRRNDSERVVEKDNNDNNIDNNVEGEEFTLLEIGVGEGKETPQICDRKVIKY